jgi:hypothetical protein
VLTSHGRAPLGVVRELLCSRSMQVFACSSCRNPVYFENFACTSCGAKLAFLPDYRRVSVLVPTDESGVFKALAPPAEGRGYRMCQNSLAHAACNWAVPESDSEALCRACRLNGIIPALEDPSLRAGWLRLEAAKRRLVYSLLSLGLPVESRKERPEGGLEFAFMADSAQGKVFTGHSDGLITINVAEADAPFRERIKEQLGEPYRTLLGHFRHEIGHYFWDRLIKDNAESLERCRALFGDERANYAEAVEHHYREGAPADFPERFVSAYATMHPWEDWAETWAHYLHMVDTLETARSHGISLQLRPKGGEQQAPVSTPRVDPEDFEATLHAWIPLTLALNSLNRSMGLADPYPFVLAPAVIQKLQFVHEVIRDH